MDNKPEMNHEPETGVDRSRLTLLLGLTSTAAAAGCTTGTRRDRSKEPYRTFGGQQYPTDDADRLGGEGGEGGGSSH